MLFLICNIVFASLFMLCLKWIQNRQREDIITVGAINYVVACVMMAVVLISSDSLNVSSNAMLIGGSMGICYFVAFFFAIFAIRIIGATGSTVISVLSIIVPILCGIFVWNETPNGLQVIGIVMAMLSLLLIGSRRKTENTEIVESDADRTGLQFRAMMLVVFFVLCGCARLAQAAYKHVCVGEPSDHFTFASFLLASVPSLVILLWRRRKIGRSEWAIGIGLGVANALQTQFIILALERFDGFVVFPVTSAGGLLLTTVVATQLLAERLSGKAYCGVALACAALVLLNW